MMLAAGRRRGAEWMKAAHSRGDAGTAIVRSFVSSQSSGSSSSSSSSPSPSPSPLSNFIDLVRKNQDKRLSAPESPSWYPQYETLPSRQHKLKVPPKKGIIRAKSAPANSTSKSKSQETALSSSLLDGNNSNKNNNMTARRRSESRQQQRQRLKDDPLMIHDYYSKDLPDFYSHDDASQHSKSSSAETLVLSDQEVDEHGDASVEQEETADLASQNTSIVDAYYAAKTINLAPLIVSDFSKNAVQRKYNKDSLILQLPPSLLSSSETSDFLSYVAVYRFGSIIFFNVGPREKIEFLQSVKRHALEPVATGFEQHDSFGVCVIPEESSTRAPRVTSEHAIVHKLNLSSVSVISEVMAQSVALDSYNEIVDSLLENFSIVNSSIATTNEMDSSLDKRQLFSKIAQINRIFIDLISKLRIKGRSQIAWDQSEYEVIHSGMTTEFDIDDRFELIQFKLDLIQQNSKLFLEVIHHQKAASVEWVIVGLIGVECVLMCLDMSGQGTAMFEYAKKLLL